MKKTGINVFENIKKNYIKLKFNPSMYLKELAKKIKQYFYENKMFVLFVFLNVLNGLRKSGCKISAPPKNRFEKRLKSGYGDCLLNMDFGNGFIGEVQIHLKNMLVAKEFRGGHKLYEAERKVYAKYDSDTPVEKYKHEDQDILKDLISEQKKIYNRAYEDSIVVASKGEKMKYILSNNEYSYYRYGSLDFPAFCYKNNFPQFYNGENWVQVKSFLDFADNAVEIDEDTFMEDLKKAGISFDEK